MLFFASFGLPASHKWRNPCSLGHIVSVTCKFSYACLECFKHLFSLPLFVSGISVFKDFHAPPAALILPQWLPTDLFEVHHLQESIPILLEIVFLSLDHCRALPSLRKYYFASLCLAAAFLAFFNAGNSSNEHASRQSLLAYVPHSRHFLIVSHSGLSNSLQFCRIITSDNPFDGCFISITSEDRASFYSHQLHHSGFAVYLCFVFRQLIKWSCLTLFKHPESFRQCQNHFFRQQPIYL